jgi:hypothetical protein
MATHAQKLARIDKLAKQLEQLAQDMNRARPGSYATDVLRFYACEIDDIAKALRQQVTLTDNGRDGNEGRK